jgi:hypothetical protein
MCPFICCCGVITAVMGFAFEVGVVNVINLPCFCCDVAYQTSRYCTEAEAWRKYKTGQEYRIHLAFGKHSKAQVNQGASLTMVLPSDATVLLSESERMNLHRRIYLNYYSSTDLEMLLENLVEGCKRAGITFAEQPILLAFQNTKEIEQGDQTTSTWEKKSVMIPPRRSKQGGGLLKGGPAVATPLRAHHVEFLSALHPGLVRYNHEHSGPLCHRGTIRVVALVIRCVKQGVMGCGAGGRAPQSQKR